MAVPTHMENTYVGGWKVVLDWNPLRPGEDKWDHQAFRDGRIIRQGERTAIEFYEALDRISGQRPLVVDVIKGLRAGLTSEQASRPVPFDDQGNPIYPPEFLPKPRPGVHVAPAPHVVQPKAKAAPAQSPAPAPAPAWEPVSLFGDDL